MSQKMRLTCVTNARNTFGENTFWTMPRKAQIGVRYPDLLVLAFWDFVAFFLFKGCLVKSHERGGSAALQLFCS